MSVRSYFARPAKSIERLMLVDAFRRLVTFGPLAEYAYVGFGAHEFIDFELIWRTLGITEMTSIEESIPVDRLEFNRPFGNIVIEFGSATSVLPRLAFRHHSIVWLDYTLRLDVRILDDVVDAARRLGSGSVLVVTVNAHPEEQISKRMAGAVSRLRAERVPAGIDDASLAKWGLADLSRRVLEDEVRQTMRSRTDRAEFEQLFNFRYADTTKMLTWGGVVVSDEDRDRFEAARFGDFDFVRRSTTPCLLEPPVLTIREILRLNDELPITSGSAGPLGWVSDEELEAYVQLHRYYPSLP